MMLSAMVALERTSGHNIAWVGSIVAKLGITLFPLVPAHGRTNFPGYPYSNEEILCRTWLLYYLTAHSKFCIAMKVATTELCY
jgi:hypothetical protein